MTTPLTLNTRSIMMFAFTLLGAMVFMSSSAVAVPSPSQPKADEACPDIYFTVEVGQSYDLADQMCAVEEMTYIQKFPACGTLSALSSKEFGKSYSMSARGASCVGTTNEFILTTATWEPPMRVQKFYVTIVKQKVVVPRPSVRCQAGRCTFMSRIVTIQGARNEQEDRTITVQKRVGSGVAATWKRVGTCRIAGLRETCSLRGSNTGLNVDGWCQSAAKGCALRLSRGTYRVRSTTAPTKFATAGVSPWVAKRI